MLLCSMSWTKLPCTSINILERPQHAPAELAVLLPQMPTGAAHIWQNEEVTFKCSALKHCRLTRLAAHVYGEKHPTQLLM